MVAVTTIKRPDPTSETGAMLERLPTFADLDFIRRKIEQVDAKLVIFDPYVAFLPQKTDSHKDQDVRSALAPLAHLAQETGAAIVLIRHLNRGNHENALYRGMGSIGLIGAARAGLLVVKHPDEDGVHIFGPTKSNLGPPMPSLKYAIEENADGVPVLQWQGHSDKSVTEALIQTSARGGGDRGAKRAEACTFLLTALQDAPRGQKGLEEEAQAHGISPITLRRAKRDLGVKAERVGNGLQGYWLWTLPPQDEHVVEADAESRSQDDHLPSQDAHVPTSDHLGKKPGYKPGQDEGFSQDDHIDARDHLGNDHLGATLEGETGGDEWKV
jgi:hypothetical protein